MIEVDRLTKRFGPVVAVDDPSFSSEYGTGLIRTTFAAVPRRRVVLAAKAAVLGTVTLAAGEVVAFTSFPAVQAVCLVSTRACPCPAPGYPARCWPRGSCCACAPCSAWRSA